MGASGERIKATFNLTPQDVERLKYLAREQGITHTEALRRAIATEHFIYTTVREGSKVLVESPKGDVRELILHYRLPAPA